MSNYWGERVAAAQSKLTTKSIKETELQLRKYYTRSMYKIVKEFEMVYLKLQANAAAGIPITPADLYKLDKYWSLQGQVRKELEKLGHKQMLMLSDQFIKQYQNIYKATALKDGARMFNIMDRKTVEQLIKQIWCADGKSWSERIWTNTDRLQQELNDNLIECVVNGKPSEYLTKVLTEQFNVSYNRADSLVKTELCHIQTQAARQRYKDAGVKLVEVWAEKDERQCKICGKLHTTRYPVNAVMPIPAHPRCRCTIIPVIE